MPTSLLEIVDLGDGEIILQRAEDDQSFEAEAGSDGHSDGEEPDVSESYERHGGREGREGREGQEGLEPLVTIRFSDEARMYIMDQSLEVAKAMIQAGIQAAAQLAEQAEVEIEATSSMEGAPRVLH